MQNPKEQNGVVSPPPASSDKTIGELEHVGGEIDVGMELDLELSLGIGPKRVRPAIFGSSSAAVAGEEDLSMVGEMDLNPTPAQGPAWIGADWNLDIGLKLGGSSETNTLAAPHAATGMNMAGVNPGGGDHKRGSAIVESTEITKPFPSVYSNGMEGVLYKYDNRDNIIIVCLCHGEFHTPAEFVKHTGGGDVPYPLRCIKILRAEAAQHGLRAYPLGS